MSTTTRAARRTTGMTRSMIMSTIMSTGMAGVMPMGIRTDTLSMQ
ncbi:MAG TPA: hypothetical protein VHY75_08110 [Steroidobacteraceae bacterium]|jgi:hypothetical protein|nr:hypothetical protein [Steroidobacteraceae bacterium]